MQQNNPRASAQQAQQACSRLTALLVVVNDVVVVLDAEVEDVVTSSASASAKA